MGSVKDLRNICIMCSHSLYTQNLNQVGKLRRGRLVTNAIGHEAVHLHMLTRNGASNSSNGHIGTPT